MVDDAQLLAVYNDQVRRGRADDGPGARREVDGPVVRQVAVGGYGWSGITWSQLASPSAADAAIARQVSYFRELEPQFEWKLYDYDQPPGPGRRPGPARRRAGLPVPECGRLRGQRADPAPPRFPPPGPDHAVRLDRMRRGRTG